MKKYIYLDSQQIKEKKQEEERRTEEEGNPTGDCR